MRNANRGTNTAEQAKVTIALKDAVSGEQLKWQFPDMVDNDFAVESVKVFDGVGKKSKKPYKAFELKLEGRTEPVRVLPMRAVEYGIAEIVNEGIEVVANTITSSDGIALEMID